MTIKMEFVNSDKPFLRYMGGKQYACKLLAEYLPNNLDSMVSPFIGAGSFELYCAAKGIRVHAYDNFATLVRHWNIMLTRAGEVMRAANKLFPMRADLLKHLIESEKIHDASMFPSPEKDIAFAAIAMCMTRQGFNGYYMKTNYFRGPGDPYLKPVKRWEDINYWDNWKNDNLSVECQEWEETLTRHHKDFLFCDPPYFGCEHYYGRYETRKTKYNQAPFNHEYLSERLDAHGNGWILTYQNDDKGYIKSLYEKFDCGIVETQWHQGSAVSQGSDNPTELIIFRLPAGEKMSKCGQKRLGDVDKIGRVYGKYYEKPSIQMPDLCQWIEREFSTFDPEFPARIRIDVLLRNAPYNTYGCSKDDVMGIIRHMKESGILIEDTDNHYGEVYLGYPKLKIVDMNKHIDDMNAEGIRVKAAPHHSYKFKENTDNEN